MSNILRKFAKKLKLVKNLAKIIKFIFSLVSSYRTPPTLSVIHRPSVWKDWSVKSSVWDFGGKAKLDFVDFQVRVNAIINL